MKKVFSLFFCLMTFPSFSLAQLIVPTYDIYSIRPSKERAYGLSTHFEGDMYEARNTSVLDLILGSYQLARPELVEGLPKWAVVQQFDIRAKISDYEVETMKNLTADQKLSMRRRLLTDIFKLKIHNEKKLQSAYIMTVMKSGPKFQSDDIPADSDEGRKRGVGGSIYSESMLQMTGCKIEELMRVLSFILQKSLIDQTGLTGRYDIELHWAPNHGDFETNETNPSILVAIEEQLGIKMLATKAPVETLMVDHIEKPAEN